VILFTAVISVTIGFVDNTYNAGIKFVNCTSPQGEKADVKECGNKLLKSIALQSN
jgi:hypothetical protein